MMGASKVTLEALWRSAAPTDRRFDRSACRDLPAPARRYLEHAIPDGAPLYRAARLTMRGEMKLGPRWRRFRAEQVIHSARGFIWAARMRVGALPVSGSDRFVDGEGVGAWRLFGAVPVASDGPSPDMNRSAAARFRIESMWLPSILIGEATWTEPAADRLTVGLAPFGYEGTHELALDGDGRVVRATMQRWGKPPGREGFVDAPFGGLVEGYATFSGYRLPSRLRVGWFPTGDGFAPDGEFWRATVASITFR